LQARRHGGNFRQPLDAIEQVLQVQCQFGVAGDAELAAEEQGIRVLLLLRQRNKYRQLAAQRGIRLQAPVHHGDATHPQRQPPAHAKIGNLHRDKAPAQEIELALLPRRLHLPL